MLLCRAIPLFAELDSVVARSSARRAGRGPSGPAVEPPALPHGLPRGPGALRAQRDARRGRAELGARRRGPAARGAREAEVQEKRCEASYLFLRFRDTVSRILLKSLWIHCNARSVFCCVALRSCSVMLMKYSQAFYALMPPSKKVQLAQATGSYM